jgi:hypothetical protein
MMDREQDRVSEAGGKRFLVYKTSLCKETVEAYDGHQGEPYLDRMPFGVSDQTFLPGEALQILGSSIFSLGRKGDFQIGWALICNETSLSAQRHGEIRSFTLGTVDAWILPEHVIVEYDEGDDILKVSYAPAVRGRKCFVEEGIAPVPFILQNDFEFSTKVFGWRERDRIIVINDRDIVILVGEMQIFCLKYFARTEISVPMLVLSVYPLQDRESGNIFRKIHQELVIGPREFAPR